MRVQKDIRTTALWNQPLLGRMPLVKLGLKFRRTTTFYKFIYQNDASAQLRRGFSRSCKYLPSIFWRGMKINCACAVRGSRDGIFPFDHPGLPRNWRYHSTSTYVSCRCAAFLIHPTEFGVSRSRESSSVNNVYIIHAIGRRADKLLSIRSKSGCCRLSILYRDCIALPFRKTTSSMRSPYSARLFSYSRKSE